jgi:hypothetical protein
MHEELDQSPARKEIADDQVAGADAVEAICEQILDCRPTTIAGLGVLALATAAMINDDVWETAPEQRDVDEEYATALVVEVLRLAGIALPFATAEQDA